MPMPMPMPAPSTTTLATALLVIFVILLLLISSPETLSRKIKATRNVHPVSHLASKTQEYVTVLSPTTSKEKRYVYGDREFENCLPKGFRPPPSAPSRYINSHPLSLSTCNEKKEEEP
ncbi:hypothetical protein AMTRI_Chr07g79570 [Amborella trichopoda]|uniref:Transmembrane protein n=1 Tax=Amborella trichopoda TaxID=13333 RepID=W1NPA7_AMBTC|nr:hypothetical protein AMTR_s00072p00115340 [Amborella trichopoda]